MSDTSQGSGWWLASDGKWYPPELWTGRSNAGTSDAAHSSDAAYSSDVGGTSAAYTPPAQPTYGSAPVGSAPFGSLPYGAGPGGSTSRTPVYGYGQSPYGVPLVSRGTNGMAVASLVCGCAGFLFFVPAILAVIFGFVARSQIRQGNGAQGGDGLAVAGIVVGFAWIALFAIILIVSAFSTKTNGVVSPAHLATLGGLT
jgi:hypothetical protein